jgi:hypothetical protein
MPIGQSLLAEMLGVQRPSITHAIADLQGAGLIERGRQQVTILDRQGLRRDLHGDALRKSECDGDAQACRTAKGFLMCSRFTAALVDPRKGGLHPTATKHTSQHQTARIDEAERRTWFLFEVTRNRG